MSIFNHLIKEISTTLKPHGFKKKNHNFYKETDWFYYIISFEKSKYATSQTAPFTIIACIVSKPFLLFKHLQFFENGRNAFYSYSPAKAQHLIQPTEGQPIDALLTDVTSILQDDVLKTFDSFNNGQMAVQHLLNDVLNSTKFVFYTAEQLLALAHACTPHLMPEIIDILQERATTPNDKLFLNDVLAELLSLGL